MTNANFAEEPVAYEPLPIPEILATGVCPVELVGPLARLTFYSDRSAGQGAVERMIVCRLVVLRSSLSELNSVLHAGSTLDTSDAAGCH